MSRAQRIVLNRKSRKEITARLRLTLPNGKKRDIDRTAKSKRHAEQILDELEAEFIAGGEVLIDAARMTFEEMAKRYLDARVVPAVFVGDRKVSGMKKTGPIKSRIKALVAYFGQKHIQTITNADLLEYKTYLIATPTRYARPRGIYDINHRLRTMRIMFNYAIRNGWLRVSPFDTGEQVFSAADELPRDRGEGKGELDRLLAACYGRRAHLKVYILLAADTALRPEERLRVTPSDIDFEASVIIARATTTKTNRKRLVPLSERLADALHSWLNGGLQEWLFYSPAHSGQSYEELAADPATTIFANIESIKTAWKSALNEAGLSNIQPRDLRHWATTELAKAMAEAGEDRAHAMRVSGHTQEKTFRRYITTDLETVQRVGAALEKHRKKKR